MDQVQMHRTLTALTCHLATLPTEPQRHTLDVPCTSATAALCHCRYMTAEMEVFLTEGRDDKFFRWLGFIQGVLWVLQHFTLSELKNQNRPS